MYGRCSVNGVCSYVLAVTWQLIGSMSVVAMVLVSVISFYVFIMYVSVTYGYVHAKSLLYYHYIAIRKVNKVLNYFIFYFCKYGDTML